MRRILVLITVLGIGLGLARARDHVTNALLSDDARLAIDVGCPGGEGNAARDCSAMLKKLYLSGSLDPDKTLRAYCDRMRSAGWGGTRREPPKLCVQRYGGWKEG